MLHIPPHPSFPPHPSSPPPPPPPPPPRTTYTTPHPHHIPMRSEPTRSCEDLNGTLSVKEQHTDGCEGRLTWGGVVWGLLGGVKGVGRTVCYFFIPLLDPFVGCGGAARCSWPAVQRTQFPPRSPHHARRSGAVIEACCPETTISGQAWRSGGGRGGGGGGRGITDCTAASWRPKTKVMERRLAPHRPPAPGPG